MKRLFVLIIALASAFCFADDVPSWLKKPEKEFPTKEYIRATGSGNSEKAAQNAAISQISLYFDTKTDVLTLAVKQSGEIIAGDKSFFASSQSFQQLTQITSNAEFFCVKFTDSWYDKKSDKFTVLAYINKKEAAQIYTARITALMEAVNAYRDYAKSEKEPFLAVTALHKAKVVSNLCEKYIHNETIIVPSDTEKWQGALKTISLIPAEHNALKKNVTFSIHLNQKDKRFDPIFSTVASILERYGYAYSVKDSNYKIILDISCIEESYEKGEFVRPSVDVLIVNNAGTGVYSYSKALPRTGSKTMDLAYSRAVTKIKQDLEENFLAE